METSSFPWDSRDEDNLSLLFLEHLDHFLLNDEFLLLLQIARLEIKWLRLKCSAAAAVERRLSGRGQEEVFMITMIHTAT